MKATKQTHQTSTFIVAIVAIVAVIGLVFLFSSMNNRVAMPMQVETPPVMESEEGVEPTGEAYTRGMMPRRQVAIPQGDVPRMMPSTPSTRCVSDNDPSNLPGMRGMVTLPPPEGLDLNEYLFDTCASGTNITQVDCVGGNVQYTTRGCGIMMCGNRPCNYCDRGVCGYFG